MLSDSFGGRGGRSDKAATHSSSCSSSFWHQVDVTADCAVMLGEMIANEAIKQCMAIQSKRTDLEDH